MKKGLFNCELQAASCEKRKPRSLLVACNTTILIVISATFFVNLDSYAADPFLAGGNRPLQQRNSIAYLSQNEFYIPYQLNDESDARVPLNLYYSKNRGQTWELYKSLIPANETTNGIRQFNVRVGADGEYWFAIRSSRIENSPT